MGLHRNVIHPKFGNLILLGAVLVEVPISEESVPVDYNPYLTCKLCVAACPVGAISPLGDFSFSSRYTHNYREFMSGFSDWVEVVAGSGSPIGYRSHSETGSFFVSDFEGSLPVRAKDGQDDVARTSTVKSIALTRWPPFPSSHRCLEHPSIWAQNRQ